MSQSAVSVFLNSVNQEGDLAREFNDLLASGEERAVPAERVVELASRKGFEFTARELKMFLAADMSLAEMEAFQHSPGEYGSPDVNLDIDGIAFEVEPDGYILFP